MHFEKSFCAWHKIRAQCHSQVGTWFSIATYTPAFFFFFYLKEHVSFKKEDKPHMVEVVGKYDLKVSGELVFT